LAFNAKRAQPMNQSEKNDNEQFWNVFNKLPQNIKDIISDPATVDIIEEIATANGVEVKTSKIIRYVDLILSGVMPITQLRESLEDELKIDQDHARKIAVDIRDKIFKQVQDELRDLHGLK
jgi:hypothetical protein